MSFFQRIDRPVVMASRWRRRQLCELRIGSVKQTVVLRDISGDGARLDTHRPPPLGTQVELYHPHAGSIVARVSEIGENEIRIAFDRQERAVAFALGAIAADMTRD